MTSAKALVLRIAKDVARAPYAWPGGYPKFLLMTDGGCLCPSCVKSEYRNIADSTLRGIRDGWQALGADINFEDADLLCDNCGEHIESAYAEGEAAPSDGQAAKGEA